MVLQGEGISSGLAFGTLTVVKQVLHQVSKRTVVDLTSEVSRFEASCQKAAEELEEIVYRTGRELGEEPAAIFRAHKMMLQDPVFKQAVLSGIQEEKVNAGYAVQTVSDQLIQLFQEMDDDYMRARVADIQDVRERLFGYLEEKQSRFHAARENSIICAGELTPGQVFEWIVRKAAAFVTIRGSEESHMAIIARYRKIPVITGMESTFLSKIRDGEQAIVDGSTGKMIVDPTEEDYRYYKEKGFIPRQT